MKGVRNFFVLMIFLYSMLVVFGLKITNNLVMAYSFLKLEKGEGFSFQFALLVDVVLVLTLVGTSCFLDNDRFPYGPTMVFIWGSGVKIASYLHFFIVVMIGGWLAAKSQLE